MKAYLHLCLKTGIALFVVCHMAAVFLYSIPIVNSNPLLRLRTATFPYTSPYLFATSQWQQWNLFAPDPLRAVTDYTVEREDHSNWTYVTTLAAENIPWLRKATYGKLLPAILNDNAKLKPIQELFLDTQCHPLGLLPGTHVRLLSRVTVIPYAPTTKLLTNVVNWHPTWTEKTLVDSFCPAS